MPSTSITDYDAPALMVVEKTIGASALADYESRYGARVGVGDMAGFLGDPTKFDFQWQNGCCYYIPCSDTFGNSHLLLVKDSQGNILYDWDKLKRRERGWENARDLYETLEQNTIANPGNAGATGNGDKSGFFVGQVPGFSHPQGTSRATADVQRWTPLPIIDDTGKVPGGIPSISARILAGFDGSINVQYIPLIPNAMVNGKVTDIAPYQSIERQAVPSDYFQRAAVSVTIGGLQMFAMVNPILRTGYLIGFQGEISTDDGAAEDIAKTIADAARIVIGVFFAPGQAVSGVIDIIKIWSSYFTDKSNAIQFGESAGAAIARISSRDYSCDLVPPAPDWVDWLKGVL